MEKEEEEEEEEEEKERAGGRRGEGKKGTEGSCRLGLMEGKGRAIVPELDFQGNQEEDQNQGLI